MSATEVDVHTLELEGTALALGLDLDHCGHLAECPACGHSGRGSANVFVGRDGRERWHCHRCEAGGTSADLLAVGLGLGDRWQALHHEQRLIAMAFIDRAELTEARTLRVESNSTALRRAHAAELASLWERSCRVSEDPAVSRWLWDARDLDVDLIAMLDLCRALPPGLALPSWASAWSSSHRCLLPLFGATGTLESVRARCIEASRAKELPPSWGPGSAKGCVFANRPALEMLRDKHSVDMLVIAEGGTDYLACATRWPDIAVIGVYAGSWTTELGARVPDGTRVVLRTDNDATGDRYASQVAATLHGRCRVLRSQPRGCA